MIARARERGLYDLLAEAEMERFLAATRRRYDLVVCADALVYVGALEPVFAGVVRVLRPGGMFAFSTEWRRGADVALTASGRYAHGRPAVRVAAVAAGLVETAVRNAVIRKEYDRPVMGTLWLFCRS
jgi:predicted TPR repeat methyltransferase